jgi:taurine transport system ATP-binding protein
VPVKDLSVQNVSMVYELPKGGSVQALHDVSFDLEAGRLLTLLGPSGCGKTTLLNIVAGFLAPSGGTVELGGTPITGPGQERGMVFQQGALFEWQNVAQNVAFGPRMNHRRSITRILEEVDASKSPEEAYRLADLRVKSETKALVDGLLNTVGLTGFGDKAIYELSGGMQQRVALARCLANEPEVILMDEPLGALDALTREKMQGLILKLWKETGKTIILVTHSVEEALFLGDKLFVMAPRPGRIEKAYELPFAEVGLTTDPRKLKASAEFIEKREELLSMIWGMEEQIMGHEGGMS